MPLFLLPDFVQEAIERLNRAGFEAYAVGGCVRDLLRGVEPHDYDITTSALPEEIIRVFDTERTIPTGIAHGTVTLLSRGGPLEITTYRIDGGYTDGRHPDAVSFSSSFKDDAARRDFTVNAMALRPSGEVLDFFGGKEDLEKGMIRAVGEPTLRFKEDALRILRAMRFASVLDFSIEEETARAMHQEKDRLTLVSFERIREELCRLICGKGVLRVLTDFADILALILPEIVPCFHFEQRSRYHIYDVYSHILHSVQAVKPDVNLRMAMLLHDIGKPATFSLDEAGVGHFYGHAEKSVALAEGILKRLRFDNASAAFILRLLRYHDMPTEQFYDRLPRLRQKHGDAFLLALLEVKRADNKAQAPLYAQRQEEIDKAEAFLREEAKKEPPFTLSSLAVKGKDLIDIGFTPSKRLGDALQFLMDAVMNKGVSNTKEALLFYLEANKDAYQIPLEIERKFLIAFPDLALISAQEGVRIFDIEQTYLYQEDEDITERIRKRKEGERTEYFHTKKRRITHITAEEKEEKITKADYEELLKGRDKTKSTIYKQRFAIPYQGRVLEIDIYPQWKKQAVLEVEMKSEKERLSFPSYISILREVTGDKRYKNAFLAKEFPSEETDE